ncbi:MAG: sodium:solute symporter family protein, partial [Symbiobacteriaceae bacterium]|nr:sodium:solute symporter family protein [Symbiobacteriaceae bacterium]
GAGLSLVLGVLSTQTYVQAVLSARDDASARRGALLSALIIPPIGIFCILIGEYMAMVYPQLNPALALPMFVLQQFPPLAAGVILATLLIAVTGTGAGLALGFATTLTNNIYLKYINKQASSRITLVVMRLLIIIALGGAVFFTMGNLRSVILAWGFLSMALRGAVLFIPLCAALFVKERVAPPFVIASSVIGLATVVVGEFIFPPYLDSLFMGVLAAAVTVGLGMARQGNKPQTPTPGASARRPQV